MKIVVFGANGKVGSMVTEQLLSEEHQVVAFVRGQQNFLEHSNLTILKGDIYNTDAVNTALVGADAVISCLGSWGTKNKDILTTGMKNIIPAMQKNNIKRLITLTGGDALLPDEKKTIIQVFTRPIFKLTAGKILRDGENHLVLLENSGLDWTTIRSPVMNEFGNPKKFQLKNTPPNPLRTVHRQSVARAIVNQLEDEAFIKKAPFIYRK